MSSPTDPLALFRAGIAPIDLTISSLAPCYGITRQGARHLAKKYDITPLAFDNPELVLEILTAEAPKSALRTNLADPVFRAEVQTKLDQLFHRKLNERTNRQLRNSRKASGNAPRKVRVA